MTKILDPEAFDEAYADARAEALTLILNSMPRPDLASEETKQQIREAFQRYSELYAVHPHTVGQMTFSDKFFEQRWDLNDDSTK